MRKNLTLITLLTTTLYTNFMQPLNAATGEFSVASAAEAVSTQTVQVSKSVVALVEQGRDRLMAIRANRAPDSARHIRTASGELAGYIQYDAKSQTSEFAFRGTCDSLWADALNAHLDSAASLGLNGRIHAGISAVARQLRIHEEVAEHLSTLIDSVDDLNGVSFQLHGDSLGGAIALLTALELSKALREVGVESPRISVVTYGAPFMFDAAAAADYQQKMETASIFRFQGAKDFFAINSGNELKRWVNANALDQICRELTSVLALFRLFTPCDGDPNSDLRFVPITRGNLAVRLPSLLQSIGPMLNLTPTMLQNIDIETIIEVILSAEKPTFVTASDMTHVGTLIRLHAEDPTFIPRLPANSSELILLAKGISPDHDLSGVYRMSGAALRGFMEHNQTRN